MTARLHSLRHQDKKSAGSGHRQQQQQQPQQQQQVAPQAPSPVPSPSLSPSPNPKHSDGRRANKPLMEKRRRARINQSLAALKALILDSARLENTKHSKLEKADILELTVRHLQRQRTLAQPGLSRYKAGYQDCSREVGRYLDAPDIITGNTTPMDPAVKQRLLRHLDSCVSELDLDLGSRPDSGLGNSPGSVTDRVTGAASPSGLDHHHHSHTTATPHCSTAGTAVFNASLIKTEMPDVMETPTPMARPDSSTAGDENNNNNNNNNSRPTSAFSQVPTLDHQHPQGAGIPVVDQASTSGQNPNMLSVVQVIPSRLPDGQVVFLLPSHYVQLAAAAAANGISIGPNPPTAIWAATNMSLLKATDKLAKRSHQDMAQDWSSDGPKPIKSPRMEQPEQPLDFTTTSKKINGYKTPIDSIANNNSCSNSSDIDVGHIQGMDDQNTANTDTDCNDEMVTIISPESTSTISQQQVKDEEGMWRPW